MTQLKDSLRLVVRRLPPGIDEDQFLRAVNPLPPHSHFSFHSTDPGDVIALPRAYFTFQDQNDLFDFKERFDDYVFVDSEGNSSCAVVELAPCQQILSDARNDPNFGKPCKKQATLNSFKPFLAFCRDLDAAMTKSADDDDKADVNDDGKVTSDVSTEPIADQKTPSVKPAWETTLETVLARQAAVVKNDFDQNRLIQEVNQLMSQEQHRGGGGGLYGRTAMNDARHFSSSSSRSGANSSSKHSSTSSGKKERASRKKKHKAALQHPATSMQQQPPTDSFPPLNAPLSSNGVSLQPRKNPSATSKDASTSSSKTDASSLKDSCPIVVVKSSQGQSKSLEGKSTTVPAATGSKPSRSGKFTSSGRSVRQRDHPPFSSRSSNDASRDFPSHIDHQDGVDEVFGWNDYDDERSVPPPFSSSSRRQQPFSSKPWTGGDRGGGGSRHHRSRGGRGRGSFSGRP